MTERYEVVPHNGIAALLDHTERRAYPFANVGNARAAANRLSKEGRPSIFGYEPGLYRKLQEAQDALFAEVEQTLRLSAADMSDLNVANMVRKKYGMSELNPDAVEFVDGKYGREMHLANGCPCGHNTTPEPEPEPEPRWVDLTLKDLALALWGELRAMLRRREP